MPFDWIILTVFLINEIIDKKMHFQLFFLFSKTDACLNVVCQKI